MKKLIPLIVVIALLFVVQIANAQPDLGELIPDYGKYAVAVDKNADGTLLGMASWNLFRVGSEHIDLDIQKVDKFAGGLSYPLIRGGTANRYVGVAYDANREGNWKDRVLLYFGNKVEF